MTPRITELAHNAVRAVVRPGDFAVDATVGNGHDTRYLAELVGPEGVVYGFDIQPEALVAAGVLLVDFSKFALFLCDHAKMCEIISAEYHGRVAAVMFNLGYLPGGSHAITTTAATTIRALAAAI